MNCVSMGHELIPAVVEGVYDDGGGPEQAAYCGACADLLGGTFTVTRRLDDVHQHQGVWRDPDEESLDLYPGLVVHDGRHSGSITVGRSRLPLTSLIPDLFDGVDWAEIVDQWPSAYAMSLEELQRFFYGLLDVRGEFARLLLILAAVEREDQEVEWRPLGEPWWVRPETTERVAAQLRECLAVVER